MSEYIGANAWQDHIDLPDGGDRRNMTNVGVPLQQLADRTFYAYAHTMIKAQRAYDAVSIWRVIGSPPIFDADLVSASAGMYTFLGTTGAVLYWPFQVPDRSIITDVEIYVRGATGTRDENTMTFSRIDLDRITIDGTTTSIGYAMDLIRAPGYTAYHPVIVPTVAESVIYADAAMYCIRLTGEHGAGSLAGLTATHPRVKVTAGFIDGWTP
jgi:hypothetical protein